eukprot:TRINITY_DN15053_c0_g1_i11.p1 TRINITY_DN15053_c0_g1~~TRINITY_DN15053_c0_g1_i11.p1  ORF type:complete len:523 (-),score=64.09 TRINITY_DN15053_c0_g1_i11:1347-2888(-)
MTDNEKIVAVEKEIALVEAAIASIVTTLTEDLPHEEKQYLRKKEEQLRKEKEQLRNKEEKLRNEEELLVRAKQQQPSCPATIAPSNWTAKNTAKFVDELASTFGQMHEWGRSQKLVDTFGECFPFVAGKRFTRSLERTVASIIDAWEGKPTLRRNWRLLVIAQEPGTGKTRTLQEIPSLVRKLRPNQRQLVLPITFNGTVTPFDATELVPTAAVFLRMLYAYFGRGITWAIFQQYVAARISLNEENAGGHVLVAMQIILHGVQVKAAHEQTPPDTNPLYVYFLCDEFGLYLERLSSLFTRGREIYDWIVFNICMLMKHSGQQFLPNCFVLPAIVSTEGSTTIECVLRPGSPFNISRPPTRPFSGKELVKIMNSVADKHTAFTGWQLSRPFQQSLTICSNHPRSLENFLMDVLGKLNSGVAWKDIDFQQILNNVADPLPATLPPEEVLFVAVSEAILGMSVAITDTVPVLAKFPKWTYGQLEHHRRVFPKWTLGSCGSCDQRIPAVRSHSPFPP